VYEFGRVKYRGREAVLDARVTDEVLLFNDTVHCAPLHPFRLFAARTEMGFDPPGTGNAARPRHAMRRRDVAARSDVPRPRPVVSVQPRGDFCPACVSINEEA
jgi:hypothetical protein